MFSELFQWARHCGTCDISRDTNLCLTVHMLVGYDSDLRLWFQYFLALTGSHTLKNLTKGSRLNNNPLSSEGPGLRNVIRASESLGERDCWYKHPHFRDEELGSPGPKSSVGYTVLQQLDYCEETHVGPICILALNPIASTDCSLGTQNTFALIFIFASRKEERDRNRIFLEDRVRVAAEGRVGPGEAQH